MESIVRLSAPKAFGVYRSLIENHEIDLMKNYFVYILLCADKSYYTGITNNRERRITEHNSGEDTNAYVFTRRPVKLIWSASFTNPEIAIEKEKQIKGWSRAKKEALIRGQFELLPGLSKKDFDK